MDYYNLIYVISIIATLTAAVSEIKKCTTPWPENMNGLCVTATECKIISETLKTSALQKFPQYAQYISKLKCGSEDSNFNCCNLLHVNVKLPNEIVEVTTSTLIVTSPTEQVTTTTEQVTTTTEPVTKTTEKEKKIEIILSGDRLNRGNISDHPNVKLLPDTCGFGNNDERVLYGSNAPMFQFLFMAALQVLEQGELIVRCGGTLINERYVLTKAVCTFHSHGRTLQSVRLGEYDLNSEKDCDKDDMCYDPVQEIPIEKIIRHSQFMRRKRIHNIALLRLSRAADTTVNNVRFICLPTTDALLTMNIRQALEIGWGATQKEQKANILQMVHLDLNKERETCEKNYQEQANFNVTEKYLCATGENISTSCKIKIAGPLFLPLKFGESILNRFVQIGIDSIIPSECEVVNQFGGSLYTHVPSYMQWILDNMEP